MEIVDGATIDCSDDRLELVRELYRRVDRTDAAGFASGFSEDGVLRWGNLDPVRGREAVEAFVGRFFEEDVETLDHAFTGVYEADGDGEVDAVLTLEAAVTYTRPDGAIASVPAVTVLDLDGDDAVLACRIYVDTAPLYE